MTQSHISTQSANATTVANNVGQSQNILFQLYCLKDSVIEL